MQWQNFLCAWSLFPIENFLIFRFEFSTRMFLETYSMEAQSETSWWSEFNPMKVFMSKWWPRHQECLSLSRRQNWISPIKAGKSFIQKSKVRITINQCLDWCSQFNRRVLYRGYYPIYKAICHVILKHFVSPIYVSPKLTLVPQFKC